MSQEGESSEGRASRFCTNCGAPGLAGSTYCGSCGAAISSQSIASTVGLGFSGTGLQMFGWLLIGIAIAIISGILAYAFTETSSFYGGPYIFFPVLFLIYVLIVPTASAWYLVGFWRWFVKKLWFSDGTQASFGGAVGQIWGIYAIIGVVNFSLQVFPIWGVSEVITFPVYLLISGAIYLRIYRFQVAEINFSSGRGWSLTAGYLPFLGWLVLLYLSMFTIIGWAWAATAMIRWIYRKIDAGQDQLFFAGKGWGLLWRGILAFVLSIFIIPIPWVALWMIRWFVGNTSIQRPHLQEDLSQAS